MTSTIITLLIASAIIAYIFSVLRSTIIVGENTQSIHYRFGQLIGILSPGRYSFWGRGHTFKELDTRLQPIALQTQELTTTEGLSIKVTAVGLYKITDPLKAVGATTSYYDTLYTLIQLTLRDLVNGLDAETLIAKTRELGPQLQTTVKSGAENLGLEVSELTIRDVILPNEVKTALSAAWRTQKEALAELEQARGKAAAVRTLANAAKVYETNPQLLQIRYYEALEKISETYGNTFIVGAPDEKALSLVKKS